jgi:hypothetical protein
MNRRATAWLRYNDKGEKRCFHCRRYLPVANFASKKGTADKLQTSCKECEANRTREYLGVNGNYAVHRNAAARISSPPLARGRYEEVINSPCVYGGGTRKEGIRVGIDRKNSHQGYTLENIQPCCAFHNSLKGEIDDGPFRQHLEAHPELKKCANRGTRQKWGEPKPLAETVPAPADELEMPLFDGGSNEPSG